MFLLLILIKHLYIRKRIEKNKVVNIYDSRLNFELKKENDVKYANLTKEYLV